MPIARRLAEHRVLVALLMLAGAIRLGAALATATGPRGQAAWREPDSELYLALAERWAAERRFDSDLPRSGAPELVRTPGYPVFLALAGLIGPREPAAIALQLGLSLGTVALVGAVARELGGTDSAVRVATLCAAVEPLGWLYAVKLLSETLALFLVMLSAWAGLRMARQGAVGMAALWGGLCGGALAAGALVRPAFYPLAVVAPLLAGIGLGWGHGSRLGTASRVSLMPRFAAVLALVLALAAGLGGWHLRNAWRAGYAGFAGIADVNLFFYQAAAVEARRTGEPFIEVRREWGYDAGEFVWIDRYGPSDASLAPALGEMRRRGRAVCWAHPLLALRVHLAGCLRTLVDPGGTDLVRLWRADPQRASLTAQAIDQGLWSAARRLTLDHPGVARVQLLLGGVLGGVYLLAGRGWWRWWRQRPLLAIITLGIGLLMVFVGGGPAATARFRQPLMPLVCVLAGLGCPGRVAGEREAAR